MGIVSDAIPDHSHVVGTGSTLAGSFARSSLLRVVLMGRPGAGKGTQGARLARRLGVQYLSTGDLLRHEISMQSPLGSAVERLVNAGRLLPAGLVVAIVETNLDGRGYVLDGFPRTVAQPEVLFEREALTPCVAIDLVVSGRAALRRLLARKRRDDDPAVARERLATYDSETAPAVDWLDRRGLVVRVDGHDSHEAVERNVWRGLQCVRRARTGSSSDARAAGSTRDTSRSELVDHGLRDPASLHG